MPKKTRFDVKKRSRVVLTVCAVLALTVIAAVCLPFTREIDTTLTATEYQLDDPVYAVEHTVTIRGYDTRNLLGRGKFVGTFAVSGFETAGEGWAAHVTFPIPETYGNTYFEVPHGNGYITAADIFSLLPNRNWTSFTSLIQETSQDQDGSLHGSFDLDTARFLVSIGSGPLDRDDALHWALDLSKGTSLEPIFLNR